MKYNQLSNIEKERTSSLIQRKKNNRNNNSKSNFNSNFANFRLKSKNIFASNNNNKSVIGNNLRRYKKESLGQSRNYSKGLSRHFNNSFNNALVDKKYLNTISNLDSSVPKNNQRNNAKLDISNDYMTINKNSNIKVIKEIKDNKKFKKDNLVKNSDLSGHKKIYSKNHYNTISNGISNYKVKINPRVNNSTGRRKNSKKYYNNNKHEKGFNSYNLIA